MGNEVNFDAFGTGEASSSGDDAINSVKRDEDLSSQVDWGTQTQQSSQPNPQVGSAGQQPNNGNRRRPSPPNNGRPQQAGNGRRRPPQNGEAQSTSQIGKVVDTATRTARQMKEDLDSDLSGDMSRKGRLGVSMFLYAIFAYGFFVFQNSTAILLITAFVILYENDKGLTRLLLNVLALYLTLTVGWSLFSSAWYFIYNLFPSGGFKGMLSDLRTIINYVWDFVFALIGLFGLSKARKGGYIRVKYVDSMFD